MRNRIAIVVIFMALGAGGCYTGPCVQGYGPIVKVNRDLRNFTAVSNSDVFEVRVNLADTFGVLVEAQENLHTLIETYVSGSTLVIQTRNGSCIREAIPVIIYVSLPQLEELRNTGSGLLLADRSISDEFEMANTGSGVVAIDTIIAGSVHLRNSGSGVVEALETVASEVFLSQTGSGDLFAGTMSDLAGFQVNHTSSGSLFGTLIKGSQVDVRLTGSGKVVLGGDARHAEYILSSSGKIDALDLMLTDAKVNVSGSGKVYVYAEGTLDVVITSSGDVYYRGTPENIYSRITGSGSIRRYD